MASCVPVAHKVSAEDAGPRVFVQQQDEPGSKLTVIFQAGRVSARIPRHKRRPTKVSKQVFRPCFAYAAGRFAGGVFFFPWIAGRLAGAGAALRVVTPGFVAGRAGAACMPPPGVRAALGNEVR